MRFSILICLACVALAAPARAQEQDCQSAAERTPEQITLSKSAINLARFLNTAQANQPGARSGKYLTLTELQERLSRSGRAGLANVNLLGGPEVAPGLELTFNVTDRGYWFMIKSVKDVCVPSVVSDQAGVIYSATPIR